MSAQNTAAAPSTALESVKVIVRSRPLLDQELRQKCKTVVTVDKSMQQMSLHDPHEEVPDMLIAKTFRFDEVFDSSATQQQVYDEAAFQIVEAAAAGYNGKLDNGHLLYRDYLCIWVDWLRKDAHHDG